MKFNNKNLYSEYIKTLDILELSDEFNYLTLIKEKVFEIYNTLIDKLKNEIVPSTKDNLYSNLLSLKEYLLSTVLDFINNRNLKLSDEVHDKVSEKALIKDIISLYADIFVIPKPQDPFFGFEPMNYKELKVSYYDAVVNLYISLNMVIRKHINNISEDKVKDIIDEVITAAEDYTEVYIIFEHIFRKQLTTEQYNILYKYNLLEKLKQLATEVSIVGFDLSDIINCFKNAIITKIIDNGEEIVLSNKRSNQLIFVKYAKDCKIPVFYDRLKFYKQKYAPSIDDCLIGLYTGEDSEFVIYLT